MVHVNYVGINCNAILGVLNTRHKLKMELINDMLPREVINVVTSQDKKGAILVRNKGIGKIAFMGSTGMREYVLHSAADNLIPAMLKLFFLSVMG